MENSTEKQLHTKGAWRINKYDSIVDETGKTILVSAGLARPMSIHPNHEAVWNSKRIVKCVNMHDELVYRLEQTLLGLETSKENREGNWERVLKANIELTLEKAKKESSWEQ